MKDPVSHTHQKIIGLTGGIASGKSSVAVFLTETFKAETIDADLVCRQLLEPQAAGWLALEGKFGNRFFNRDRTVDRPLLRRALFDSAGLRHEIDALLHPLAREEIRQRIRARSAAASGGLRLLVEVPLLYEARWENDFDAIVVVYASNAACRKRLMNRDGVTGPEAENALAAQLPLADKARRADHVVDNSGAWWETSLQLLRLGKVLWGG